MDKNTIFGMLLMGLVLFGFMYCNRPDPNAQQQDTTEQAEAVDNAVDKATAASAVTLTPDYLNTVMADVRQYGTLDSKTGVYGLTTANLSLTVNPDSTLDGVVDVAGTPVSVSKAFAGDSAVTPV